MAWPSVNTVKEYQAQCQAKKLELEEEFATSVLLKDLIYLLPNGNLVRCGMDNAPIGNLREQSFDEIWYGESIRSRRQKVTDCPGCMQSSVQIMSRVYGGCFTA